MWVLVDSVSLNLLFCFVYLFTCLLNYQYFFSYYHFFFFSPQDSSQIELLKELMDLQKDMIVMMLSLLEGSISMDYSHILFVNCTYIQYFYSTFSNGTEQRKAVKHI